MARVDLKIDDGLLEKVQKIAKERFRAKVHHISGKPEVTPTLIHLIEYGIQYLESGFNTDKYTDNLPENYLNTLSPLSSNGTKMYAKLVRQ